MRRPIGIASILLTLTGIAVIFTTAAYADTVSGVGIASGTKYRGGLPSQGGISYGVSVQVNKDAAGHVTKVRGAARITKVSKATAVQVDTVVLGTSTVAVLANRSPVNSRTAASALSYTGWRAVAAGTCTSYRVRAYYSVRWSDGGLSKFSILSPLARICGPAVSKPPSAPAPRSYPNCKALNAVYPHGVGRPGAVDHTSGTPVTNFYVSAAVYNLNTARDADKDGIACEKH